MPKGKSNFFPRVHNFFPFLIYKYCVPKRLMVGRDFTCGFINYLPRTMETKKLFLRGAVNQIVFNRGGLLMLYYVQIKYTAKTSLNHLFKF